MVERVPILGETAGVRRRQSCLAGVESLASGCGPKPPGGLERISSVDGPELLAGDAAASPADRALFGRIVALVEGRRRGSARPVRR